MKMKLSVIGILSLFLVMVIPVYAEVTELSIGKNFYTIDEGIIFLGIYPKPLLERIEPAVDRLLIHIEEHSDYERPEPNTPVIIDVHHETEKEEGH